MKLRGSLTIEASLIFPIILFVLITILFIALYLHELTCLQAIGSNVGSSAHEIFKETSKENAELVLTEEIERLAKRDLLLQQGELDVNCQITEGLLSDQLDVNINKEFVTPFKAINQLMNFSTTSYIKIEVQSTSKLIDPTAFIRGVDFMDDISSELTITSKLKEKFIDTLDQLESIIDKWV